MDPTHVHLWNRVTSKNISMHASRDVVVGLPTLKKIGVGVAHPVNTYPGLKTFSNSFSIKV